MQVITVCAYLWLSHSRLSTRHKHFILWYLLRADKLSRSCIWMWNQRSWRAKKNNFSVYSLQRRVAICPFCYQTIGSFRVSFYGPRGENVFFSPDRRPLLSESEASLEGRHSGESHLPQESAARGEAGAHRWEQTPVLSAPGAAIRAEISRCFSSVHY